MSIHFRQTSAPSENRKDWANIRALMPYLWEYRGRVLLALSSLILAKVANVGVPLVLKGLVDKLDMQVDVLVVLPVALSVPSSSSSGSSEPLYRMTRR